MNSDVHPVVVAIVLLLTGVAIGIWMWGSGVAASFGGPAALAVAPDGHRFVQIQNHLVEHDAKGAFLRTHDLEELDVEQFLGGFAFFSNGDVLLRRGPDPRSTFDNLRAFGRATNVNSVVPDEPRSGLFRCELETSYCERFGENGVDFKAAYSVYIDWETDEVYISDTTRHLLRKYSSKGVELAPPVGGFMFPNDLLVHDGQLFVADTNHHVIRALQPESSTFGESIDSKDVVPSAAKPAGHSWPSRFARVHEQWWVNNMQSGMDNGGIYVFDADWRYVRRIELPPVADPISLLAVEDAVWVSDWNNDVVRRFSPQGEPLGNLESSGLETILAASREERRKYTFLSYGGIALIVLLFLGLLVRGFAISMNKTASKELAETDEVEHVADTGPLYLEPDEAIRKRMNRLLGFIGILTLLISVLAIFLFATSGKPELLIKLVAPLAGLVAIVALIVWMSRANWGTSIAVDNNTLTLQDYAGRQSSCSLHQVRFNATAIATPDGIVMLGNAKARIYDEEDIEERLVPRLAHAQEVGPFEILKIQVQLMHPQGIFTVLAIVGLGVFAIAQIVV